MQCSISWCFLFSIWNSNTLPLSSDFCLVEVFFYVDAFGSFCFWPNKNRFHWQAQWIYNSLVPSQTQKNARTHTHIKCPSKIQNIEQNRMKKRQIRPKLKHTHTQTVRKKSTSCKYVRKYSEKSGKGTYKNQRKKSTTTAFNSRRKKSITHTHMHARKHSPRILLMCIYGKIVKHKNQNACIHSHTRTYCTR